MSPRSILESAIVARGAARWRRLAGAALAMLVVPFLLGDSCNVLVTPIGDPERGWADPRISGVWLGGLDKRGANREARPTLWVFEPYDARTWLLTLASFELTAPPSTVPPSQVGASASDATVPASSASSSALEAAPGGAKPAGTQAMNAADFLHAIGEERAKPQNGLGLYKAWLTTLGGRRFLVLEPKAMTQAHDLRASLWLVYLVELQGGSIRLSAIKSDVEGLAKAKTRAQAEEIIARHAQDPSFVEFHAVLQRVPKTDYDLIARALDRARGAQ